MTAAEVTAYRKGVNDVSELAPAANAAAYRQGVRDVIDLARRAATGLEDGGRRPLHHGFAIEALRALADQAEALTKPATRTQEPRP